jgi:hypothetical protein
MTRLTLAAATVALGVLTAGSVMAGQCPTMVKAIDAGMAGNSQLSQAQKDEAKALRDEGAKLHKAGKHSESVATLAKAKAIIGIM